MAAADAPPKSIISDKLGSYIPAIKQVFPDTEHIQFEGLRARVNNLSERLQVTIRDREKTLRAIDSLETGQKYFDGWATNYNLFREHEGIEGQTPPEMAGVSTPFTEWADVVRIAATDAERKRDTKTQTPTLSETADRAERSNPRIVPDSTQRRRPQGATDHTPQMLGFETVEQLNSEDLRRMVRENDPADIATVERQSFYRADLVAKVENQRGNEFFLAVEASYTADEGDTQRAGRNANLIGRFTSIDAVSIPTSRRERHRNLYRSCELARGPTSARCSTTSRQLPEPRGPIDTDHCATSAAAWPSLSAGRRYGGCTFSPLSAPTSVRPA